MKRSVVRRVRGVCLTIALPTLGLASFAAPASAATVNISGNFDALFNPPAQDNITEVTGSFGLHYDDSTVPSTGPYDISNIVLDSFSLSPNPFGAGGTVFGTTNLTASLGFSDGAPDSVFIYGNVGTNCPVAGLASNCDGLNLVIRGAPEVAVDLRTNAPTSLQFAFSDGNVPNINILNSDNTPPLTASITFTSGAQPPPTHVPEPATLALFGFGLAGLGFMRRRKRAA